MATEASLCNNRTSQNFGLEDSGVHLRDASFSSYLGRGDDAFMMKLSESIATSTSAVITATEPLHQYSFGRKYHQDSEISIFNAEKYLKGGKQDESMVSSKMGRRPEMQRGGRTDQLRGKSLLQPATPSLCSEVNGNSQTALLRRLQKDAPMNWQKQGASRRIFSSLACSSCSRKKSVNINEQATESRNASHSKTNKAIDFDQRLSQEIATYGVCQNLPSHARNNSNHSQFRRKEQMDLRVTAVGGFGSKKEDYFNFPTLNQIPGNMTVGKQFEVEEKARMPEAFGFRFLGKDRSHSPLRSLTMLTSDAGWKINEEIAQSTVGHCRMDEEDDLGSDSSSDLFEIESLKGKAYPISSRRPSDDLSSCAATTRCSKPSEAIIERSFATASPTSLPMASDHHDSWKQIKKSEGETRLATATTACKSSTIKISMVKEAQQRRRQNSLLGCKGSNSVEVAMDAYNSRRFQSDFESMHGQRVPATCSVSDSHMPDTLFIHG